MKTKGLHPYRFKENPEEKRFAEAWAQHDDPDHVHLAYLLHVGSQGGGIRPVGASERDKVVAATVIQWLGSPVGQGFLRDLGYEKKT
jgi:hypothetical protein